MCLALISPFCPVLGLGSKGEVPPPRPPQHHQPPPTPPVALSSLPPGPERRPPAPPGGRGPNCLWILPAKKPSPWVPLHTQVMSAYCVQHRGREKQGAESSSQWSSQAGGSGSGLGKQVSSADGAEWGRPASWGARPSSCWGGGRGTGLERPPRAGPCAGGSAPSPGPPVTPRFSPPHLLYRGAGTRTRTRARKVGIEWEGPQMTDHRLCDRPCVHPQNRPSRPSRSCCLRRWSNWREAARAHVWGRGHWSL